MKFNFISFTLLFALPSLTLATGSTFIFVCEAPYDKLNCEAAIQEDGANLGFTIIDRGEEETVVNSEAYCDSSQDTFYNVERCERSVFQGLDSIQNYTAMHGQMLRLKSCWKQCSFRFRST